MDLEPGAAGEAWKALGRRLPRPKAILIAPAHWETNVPMLTGSDAVEVAWQAHIAGFLVGFFVVPLLERRQS